MKLIENLHTINDVKSWFSKFINDDEKKVFILTETPETFWENIFVPAFNLIKAAGGVVIRNQQILFILRNKKWDLPKGKIDNGELTEEAALREVEEECGITGHAITKELPSTYHIYLSPYKESKGEWILKETFWFEMEYNGTENGKPQTEENISEIKWADKNELDLILASTYENLKPVIKLYLA